MRGSATLPTRIALRIHTSSMPLPHPAHTSASPAHVSLLPLRTPADLFELLMPHPLAQRLLVRYCEVRQTTLLTARGPSSDASPARAP